MRGPLRVPGAADVDVHDRVAVGHPEHRVGRLERGVLRRVAFLHAGVEEASRIERHVFAVRAPGDDRRHRPLVGGPVDVDVELDAVAQCHCEVALDDHRVFVFDRPAVGRRLAAAFLRGVARAAVAILEGSCRHGVPLHPLNFFASASAVRASNTVSVPTATNE